MSEQVKRWTNEGTAQGFRMVEWMGSGLKYVREEDYANLETAYNELMHLTKTWLEEDDANWERKRQRAASVKAWLDKRES